MDPLAPPTMPALDIRADDRLLTSKYIRIHGMPVSQVDFLLAHPGVEMIELRDCSWSLTTDVPRRDSDDFPSSSRNGQAAAALTVRLVGTHIDEFGLAELLDGLPRLRALVYARPADEADRHFDLFGDALRARGARLEHLALLNEGLAPFDTPVGARLRGLPRLRSLEVDLELLVGFYALPRGAYDEFLDGAASGGWRCLVACGGDGGDDFGTRVNGEGEDREDKDEEKKEEEDDDDDDDDEEEEEDEYCEWSLVDMLPSSLESLTLHIESSKLDAYFNTYERYGDKFEALLRESTAAAVDGGRFSRLRRVCAPRLAPVAEKMRNSGGIGGWVFQASSSTMTRTVPPPVERERVVTAVVTAVVNEVEDLSASVILG